MTTILAQWVSGEGTMMMPVGWVIGAIATMGVVIGTLATIMWDFMKSRLAAQDDLIKSQGFTIERLQNDVDRLSKGCGQVDCLWRGRQ